MSLLFTFWSLVGPAFRSGWTFLRGGSLSTFPLCCSGLCHGLCYPNCGARWRRCRNPMTVSVSPLWPVHTASAWRRPRTRRGRVGREQLQRLGSASFCNCLQQRGCLFLVAKTDLVELFVSRSETTVFNGCLWFQTIISNFSVNSNP
jgi:hypothetical protein